MKAIKMIMAMVVCMICSNISGQELTANDITITPNGTATMTISLTGSTDIASSAQFDINLPDGVEVETNSSGRLKSSRGEMLTDDNVVVIQKVSSGAIRVEVYNPYNEAFAKANGVVITVPLKASNISVGSHKGTLSGIIFAINSTTTISGSDEKGHLSDSEFTITVTNTTDIKGIDADNSSEEGNWYTLMGASLSGKPTQPGVYIHNGKKIVIR